MPRTCFVIMPFSSTASCTEDEWTKVFEEVFKPAVENAGLDFECRRSVATRGNLVAAILRDLSDAWVVLADLTDRNANVFYELGVRHTLKDRSIILAQRAEDIPFDLQAYARHVYDWKTEEGRAALAKKLKELLAEVDQSPGRPDNPVSDFLKGQPPIEAPPLSTVTPEEAPTAQPLAGPGAEGLDASGYARRLARTGRPISVVVRLTRAELVPLMTKAVEELNRRPVANPIQRQQVPDVAGEYIKAIEPTTSRLEEFVLASAEEDWPNGVLLGVKIAGTLIGLSEQPPPQVNIKFARGLPALLAWRLLVLIGTRALASEAFSSLNAVLKEPIEVEHLLTSAQGSKLLS